MKIAGQGGPPPFLPRTEPLAICGWLSAGNTRGTGEGTMAIVREDSDQVTGTVPVQVGKQVRAIALLRGVNMSQVVREAVVEFVQNHPVDRDALLRELGLDDG